ncbi:MAG: hypothetical protein WD000_08155 [Thermodesulfobacteriota bacterium]
MKTLLIIAILFATTVLVTGVQSFTPSFIATASAQNEEEVEVEEGEVEETYEEEEQPEQESEPATDAGA